MAEIEIIPPNPFDSPRRYKPAGQGFTPMARKAADKEPLTLHTMSTTYLKQVWDHMGKDDGVYGDFTVDSAGHDVNGLFMDDVYHELVNRGEQAYVAF